MIVVRSRTIYFSCQLPTRTLKHCEGFIFCKDGEGNNAQQFVDNHKVGDVFIIYYRVRSTRELQDKENKLKALVGRPIDQETWFGGITDAIDLQRAHAAILIDFAGASTDTHLSGQRFDLVVDEQGEVDVDDWYMRDIPIDPTINIIKWARVGQINHTPAGVIINTKR